MELEPSLAEYGLLGLGWIIALFKDREITAIRKDLLENVKADAQAKQMLQNTLDRLVHLVESAR